MNDEYKALKFYLKLILFSTIYIGFITIVNYQSYGEAANLTLTLGRDMLFLILVMQCSTILFAYFFFIKTKKLRFTWGCSYYKFVIDGRKIHPFILVVLVAQIIFSLKTGNGVVGSTSVSSLSGIFNIFNVQSFMPIYYIVARDVHKKIYWINVICYVIYEIICGWSGFILTIACFELFLYLKYGKRKEQLSGFFKFSSLATIIGLMIGGKMYCYAAIIKERIRYGYMFDFLSFPEGLSRLVSRLTNYPISVLGIQNHSEIASLYINQGVTNWEVLSIFRSLLPGFLMPNKSYRTLSNIVLKSLYPNITNTTSTGYSIWVYWANLAESDFVAFTLFLVVVLVLFIISKMLIYAFDNGSGDVEILYFFLVFNLFNGSGIETLFAYNYIGLIYILPIMIALGIIKIERNTNFAYMNKRKGLKR